MGSRDARPRLPLEWSLPVCEGASGGQAREARLVCCAKRERVAAGAAEARDREPVSCVDAAGSWRYERCEVAGVGELPRPGVGLGDGEVLERVIADAEGRVDR